HFVPRPVQLNAVRQNVNSVRPHVNTGRANVNSVREIGALLLRPQQVIIGGKQDQTPIVNHSRTWRTEVYLIVDALRAHDW
ncbi:hypothetical protein Tco_0220377, partial [Tanacetum coccineum]